MPDRRRHRGAHPEDSRLFGAEQLAALRAATGELSWLLGRGFTLTASGKLVGDRHRLTERQRKAVARCACPDQTVAARRERMHSSRDALRDQTLWIDGFNVLTTLEVALSGGVVMLGRDGVLRDIAGVHGSYRKVHETEPALELLHQQLRSLELARCCFLLDRPVSNSGRLAALIEQHAAQHGLAWEARVVADPDPELWRDGRLCASADGQVLDRCQRWVNLARWIVEAAVPGAFLLDLSFDTGAGA